MQALVEPQLDKFQVRHESFVFAVWYGQENTAVDRVPGNVGATNRQRRGCNHRKFRIARFRVSSRGHCSSSPFFRQVGWVSGEPKEALVGCIRSSCSCPCPIRRSAHRSSGNELYLPYVALSQDCFSWAEFTTFNSDILRQRQNADKKNASASHA